MVDHGEASLLSTITVLDFKSCLSIFPFPKQQGPANGIKRVCHPHIRFHPSLKQPPDRLQQFMMLRQLMWNFLIQSLMRNTFQQSESPTRSNPAKIPLERWQCVLPLPEAKRRHPGLVYCHMWWQLDLLGNKPT